MLINTAIDYTNNYSPIKVVDNKYIISWDLEKYDNMKSKWKYFVLDYKPTISEIKKVINDYINERVKYKIINGFYWNNMHIYLSLENQLNYKLLFDVTNLQNGSNLPEVVKFKVNNEDVFYSFETLDDMKDFIISLNNHIRKLLQLSDEAKNSIDYSLYEI